MKFLCILKRAYMILMITAMAKMFLLSTGLLHHICHLLLTTMKKEHTFLIMQRPLNTCKLLPERKSFHFLVLGRKIWKILKIFWLKVSLIEQRLMMQLRESRRYACCESIIIVACVERILFCLLLYKSISNE